MKKALLPLAIAAVATTAQAGTVTTEGSDIELSTNGGLKAATSDGQASVQLGGRIQWDYDATEAEDYGIDNDDLDVRRARLFVQGHYGDWTYKAQFNIAENEGASGGDAEDLYVRYTGFGNLANITVGKQKEPFGLETLTSGNDTSALERSAMSELYTPGRSGGVQLHGKGANWTYGVGVFEADGNGSNDFGDTAFTGRATFAPILSDDMVLHLGAGFTTRDADVDNVPTTTEDVEAYNLELGLTTGPFHAQAEYFDSEVSGDFGDVDRDGYYLQAGWIITGETRPYRDGVFKRVKPAAASGAWEVILRYEDGDGRYSDVGLATVEGNQTTFGVNYYANNNVRLGLSYMTGEEDSTDFEGDELRARVQFVF
ncbi:OprO/OprP family phosphate-selective porin [Gilvimarinus sp. F26214L]|uniref:OprO/OprP family phosphate-selective porin n=1 Tax=Gilvimarinus sp. DZF01 TaxID=3461371 RepID=UPI0040454EE2